MKLDILAFGAHPDDVELGAAATLSKEVSLGKKVGIIDLTQGELSTRGSKKLRKIESDKAAKILGASLRVNLKFSDGFFINDQVHQLKLIKLIRKHQPEIVLCNAVEDRHIDHGKGSKLVSDACFLSGLQKIRTKLKGKSQERWRPKKIYHYMQWNNDTPDFVVDVSGFMETKMKAVLAYRSQFYDPNSNELESPITSKNFIDSVVYRAKELGRLIGVNHAEGFTVQRLIAVSSLDKLI